MTTNFFSAPSFVAGFGSGIRDPGSGMGKNQDPGSGINIPDPQHWIPQPSVAPFWASTTPLRASMAIYGSVLSLQSSWILTLMHPDPQPLLGIVSRKTKADPDRFVSSGVRTRQPVANLLIVVGEDFSFGFRLHVSCHSEEIPNDPGKMFIGGLSWQTTPEV